MANDPKDALIRKLRTERVALLKAQEGFMEHAALREAEITRRGDIIRALSRGAFRHDTMGDVKDDAVRAAALIGISLIDLEDNEILEALDGESLWEIKDALATF